MIRNLFKAKSENSHQAGSPLAPGTPAPDFTLPSGSGGTISLSDFRGQPVVLVFYPADWSRVCGDQVVLYNEILPIFEEYQAQLLGISVDGVWCHKAFAEAHNLDFPLLADFEPKGAVARAYGVYREEDGTSERALFVVDAEGIVHWSYVSPIGVNPGANGILAALEELQAKRSLTP
jgi:peroxiredoxin